MSSAIFRIASMVLCCIPLACSVELTSAGNRSGTVTDDQVEEPLSKASQKYEGALQLSNRILDRFMAGEYQAVYDEDCGELIRSQADLEAFTELVRSVERKAGPIKGYKPMQWSFLNQKRNGVWLLHSRKIVEHEKGLFHYTFVFAEAGPYDKLVGIHFANRKGVLDVR